MSAVKVSVGVIVCSTRTPRVGPQVAAFIFDTIKESGEYSNEVNFSIIDLSDWKLPIFDESGIPSTILASCDYDHEHTRQWSIEISRYDAFIFITPQYNWGYPASLKNAIDYLYNEWKGKPGMIASYGGHGGGKAAAQLAQVLSGIRMRPVETMPALAFGSKENVRRAAMGETLDLTIWEDKKCIILESFNRLLELARHREEVTSNAS